MKIFKCPKCKSPKIVIKEQHDDYAIYRQNPDGSIIDYGRTYSTDILGVFGHCQGCFHDWRFRKVTQITDLIKDLDDRLKKGGE